MATTKDFSTELLLVPQDQDEASPAYNAVNVQFTASSPPEEKQKNKALVSFSEDVGCTIHEIASIFEQQSYNSKGIVVIL